MSRATLLGSACRWVLALLVAGMVVGGCACSRKPDEEVLRERIDTTKVHLYLAAKVALVRADSSPEAKKARDAFVVLSQLAQGREANGTVELEAKDVLAAGEALWTLREEGKKQLALGRDAKETSILPVVLPPGTPLLAMITPETEHAALLTALFMAKFHPKSPVPVPVAIMLYEAWLSDTPQLVPLGLAPFVRAIKAIVFSQNELCDLAAREADGVAKDSTDAAGLLATLRQASGKDVRLDAARIAQLGASSRVLAHGATAVCYVQRKQEGEAVEHLDRTLVALDDLGVPKEDTALLRAYVALHRGEFDTARAELTIARDNPATDAETRADIETLLAQLDDKDAGAFDKTFGKAYFLTFTVKLALRELDRAGVFDSVKELPAARTVLGFATAAGEAIGSTDRAVQAGQGVKERGEGWLRSLLE